jgi:hypothetical protein
MILLSIEGPEFLTYAGLILLAMIIWFQLLRWAVRANDIVKHQKFILQLLIEQYKKQGATEEELNKLKEEFDQ